MASRIYVASSGVGRLYSLLEHGHIGSRGWYDQEICDMLTKREGLALSHIFCGVHLCKYPDFLIRVRVAKRIGASNVTIVGVQCIQSGNIWGIDYALRRTCGVDANGEGIIGILFNFSM